MSISSLKPCALSILLAGVCLTGVAHADEAGLALAQKVYDRADGQDSSAALTMELTEQGRAPRSRDMFLYRQDKGGNVATMVRFTSPADIAGTGLLTQDPAAGDTNQWIYLPAMERVRRIDADRKGGRFVNSDYYFEDLRDRKPAMDSHRITGQDSVNGVACDLLESIPAQASNSVYKKRVSCIDPNSLLPLRVEFYEKNPDTISKRLAVARFEQVNGYWTIMDSTLADLGSGHQTRLTVNKIVYDRGLPDTLFSNRALEDERTEATHRP